MEDRGSLARGGGLIAPALMLLNVVAYVLTVSAAHVLDKDAYGELVALLGVVLVASVPFIAVQAVVARAVVAGTSTPRALVVRSAQLGALATGLAALLSPVVAAFLHSSVAGPLCVAAQLAPFAVLSAAMGVLQGGERFGALALVVVGQGLARGAGLVPLALDGGSTAVLAALATGMWLAAAGAVLITRPAGSAGPAFGLTDVAHATSGILALLVLANVDVLLARNVLSGDESGRYSVGSVLSKAAFWLPQAVAVVVFPRLSDPVEGRALLRRALLFVGALGGVELLGCLLLARPVLELTFGDQYGSLAPYAWLWVVQGAALSLVQLLVYRAIAVQDRVTGAVIGAAAAVEAAVVLLWRPSRPSEVIAVVATAAVLTTVGLLARSDLRTRGL